MPKSQFRQSARTLPPRERPLPHPSWLRAGVAQEAARAITPEEFWSRLGE